MKISTVLPFLGAVNALFEAYDDALKIFDPHFLDPYHDHVFQPHIDAVILVVPTDSMRSINKGYTDDRNIMMDELIPTLRNLRYKIKKCRNTDTITDSLASFKISEIISSITHRNVKSFHIYYEEAILQINKTDNKAALIAAGYTQLMITNITTHHDDILDIQNNKIDLKENISDLSASNQKIIYDALTEAQKIIDGLQAMAESNNDKELMKRATKTAILKSVDPTPPKEPIVRIIKPTFNIIIATRMPVKDSLHLTLLNDTHVKLYRAVNKTDPCVTGISLVLNTPWTGQVTTIPGNGVYIKLHNEDLFKKAQVSVIKIKGRR